MKRYWGVSRGDYGIRHVGFCRCLKWVKQHHVIVLIEIIHERLILNGNPEKSSMGRQSICVQMLLVFSIGEFKHLEALL